MKLLLALVTLVASILSASIENLSRIYGFKYCRRRWLLVEYQTDTRLHVKIYDAGLDVYQDINIGQTDSGDQFLEYNIIGGYAEVVGLPAMMSCWASGGSTSATYYLPGDVFYDF
ncbi:uncharacterized protein F4812DRAFT_460945 [Daldinia caldariorum]|uniref:uncharacterized protein n=1 Tax=Daldinia caldariorum TaxID=326644 RepID=UPI002007B6AA|nr:uncharacterized protein F4812DRAFT_460945 [Daldinia caldariorum]KAI1465966.1 hypothetical protein F4812DRAFT_460945 [Daldinia caldariorum]